MKVIGICPIRTIKLNRSPFSRERKYIRGPRNVKHVCGKTMCVAHINCTPIWASRFFEIYIFTKMLSKFHLNFLLRGWHIWSFNTNNIFCYSEYLYQIVQVKLPPGKNGSSFSTYMYVSIDCILKRRKYDPYCILFCVLLHLKILWEYTTNNSVRGTCILRF